MKKITSITYFFVFISVFQSASADSDSRFETYAQAVLGHFDMALGMNQHLVIVGQTLETKQDCSITVNNASKISPTFPGSTKATQRLEVIVQIDQDASKFKLSRESEVTQFATRNAIGVSLLVITANNKTGIGDGRMPQILYVRQSVRPQAPLTVSVTDFGGVNLTCISH